MHVPPENSQEKLEEQKIIVYPGNKVPSRHTKQLCTNFRFSLVPSKWLSMFTHYNISLLGTSKGFLGPLIIKIDTSIISFLI